MRKKTFRVKFVSGSINFNISALMSEVYVESLLEGTKYNACRLVYWSLKLSFVNWFERATHFFENFPVSDFAKVRQTGFDNFVL